jgi:hypothetical protein
MGVCESVQAGEEQMTNNVLDEKKLDIKRNEFHDLEDVHDERFAAFSRRSGAVTALAAGASVEDKYMCRLPHEDAAWWAKVTSALSKVDPDKAMAEAKAAAKQQAAPQTLAAEEWYPTPTSGDEEGAPEVRPKDIVSLFEEAVGEYHSAGVVTFDTLRKVVTRHPELARVVPIIVKMATSLLDADGQPAYDMVKHGVHPLNQGRADHVILTHQECTALLANAFCCTLKNRQVRHDRAKDPHLSSYGVFSCHQLLQAPADRNMADACEAKLECFMRFFARRGPIVSAGVRHEGFMPEVGTVKFRRHVVNPEAESLPDWSKSKQVLLECHGEAIFVTQEAVEDLEKSEEGGTLQVDFSCPFVGGDVFAHGCGREEALFVTHPELMVACFVSEKLLQNEALTISGAEQLTRAGHDENGRTGLHSQFRCEEEYYDPLRRPELRRHEGMLNRKVVAIDALAYGSAGRARGNVSAPASAEFTTDASNGALRELNKAYVGFHGAKVPSGISSKALESTLAKMSDEARAELEHHNQYFSAPMAKPVATSDWVEEGGAEGCNVLKAVLQLLAASQSGRGLIYSVPNDAPYFEMLKRLSTHLKGHTVGEVWSALSEIFKKGSVHGDKDLVDALCSKFSVADDSVRESHSLEHDGSR